MNFPLFEFSRADVAASDLADNGFEPRIFKNVVYFYNFFIYLNCDFFDHFK